MSLDSKVRAKPFFPPPALVLLLWECLCWSRHFEVCSLWFGQRLGTWSRSRHRGCFRGHKRIILTKKKSMVDSRWGLLSGEWSASSLGMSVCLQSVYQATHWPRRLLYWLHAHSSEGIGNDKHLEVTTGGWRAVIPHDDTPEAISVKSSYYCR